MSPLQVQYPSRLGYWVIILMVEDSSFSNDGAVIYVGKKII